MNWQQAFDYCQGEKANLVHIKSGKLNTKVLNYVRKFPFTSSIWIGFNQTGPGKKDWSWQPDLEPLDWTAWARNQPNNLGGKEDCGSMLIGWIPGAWDDGDCLKKWPFVCMSLKRIYFTKV